MAPRPARPPVAAAASLVDRSRLDPAVAARRGATRSVRSSPPPPRASTARTRSASRSETSSTTAAGSGRVSPRSATPPLATSPPTSSSSCAPSIAPRTPPGRTLGEAFDALLGDLLTAGKIALDAEVVATLAAYYRARLADPNASTASVNDALKTLAHVLQEGGNHAPPAEVDALFPAILARVGASSRDVSRHALNALGALVSRSPAGTVTAAAHAAAGDAVVAALDRIADGARGGAFPRIRAPAGISRRRRGARSCAPRPNARRGPRRPSPRSSRI